MRTAVLPVVSRVGLLVLACSAGLALADAAGLAERLASAPGRAEADRERDADRKPALVVTFLGIGEGTRVIDLIAAGGYYTEVLSVAVGPKGKVYAQNPEFALKIREGANDKALTQRLAGGRLANVVRLDTALEELALEPASLDAAFTALNFHDVYNGIPGVYDGASPEAAVGFLKRVRALLKPGGVLGIVDHVGIPGQDNTKLHRIEEKLVVESAKAAGFEVEARAEMLASSEDDHTQNVFAPGLRGKTDRFVLRLRKPR